MTFHFIKGIAAVVTSSTVLLFLSCKITVEKEYTNNFEYSPNIAVWQNNQLRFCCNGTVTLKAQNLEKGHYEIKIETRGTKAYDVFPLIGVLVNDSLLKEIRLDSRYVTYKVPYELNEDGSVSIGVSFDQDGLDDKGNDRDVLIRSIGIEKR